MIPLSEAFDVSLQMLSYANGATLICQGVATTLWMWVAVRSKMRDLADIDTGRLRSSMAGALSTSFPIS